MSFNMLSMTFQIALFQTKKNSYLANSGHGSQFQFVTQRCEKNCCSITALPLCCCVTLTIHKSQGKTVGPGQQFQKLIITLPAGNTRSAPGLELVAFSCAKSLDCLEIGNASSELSYQSLMKIGATLAYLKRRAFQNELRQWAVQSQRKKVDRITDLDPSPGQKSFEGRCQFLVDLYMELPYGTYYDIDQGLFLCNA